MEKFLVIIFFAVSLTAGLIIYKRQILKDFWDVIGFIIRLCLALFCVVLTVLYFLVREGYEHAGILMSISGYILVLVMAVGLAFAVAEFAEKRKEKNR